MNYTTETLLPCERLEAYHLAVDFHRNVVPLARARGFANLRDQLLRAAESAVLNIAEGAGLTSLRDKKHRYEIALGSIVECGAVLDLLRNRQAISEADYTRIRAMAIRNYQILSRLAAPPR
jgi:four helix bundle protein